MPGKIVLDPHITRSNLRSNPDILFAFGDNMHRYGYGGQAKQMRGEPNAVGIPTKWSPFTSMEAYFIDSDLNDSRVRGAIDEAFNQLAQHLESNKAIVLPANGIGTGLSQLEKRAPHILKYIEDHVVRLYQITERNKLKCLN